MKKLFTCLLVLTSALCCALGLAACGGTPHEAHVGPWQQSGDHRTHFRICTECGEREVVDCTYIDVVVAPTCETDGYTADACTACGDVIRRDETPALQHDYPTEWTYDGAGKHYKVCANDPAHRIEEDCEDVVTVVAPTCTEEGYTLHSCPDCGAVRTENVQKPLGHDYPDAWEIDPATRTHRNVCQRENCGHVEAGKCEFTETVVAPTCETDGYTLFTCKECHDTYRDVPVPAKGHDWGDEYFASEGNAEGHATHYRVCKNDATHHDVTECGLIQSVTEATCDHGGSTIYGCPLCRFSYEADKTDPLEHLWSSYRYNDDGTHTRICDLCHTEETDECDVGEGVVTAPTCTTKGYTTYTCSDCGNSYRGDEKDVTPHVYGAPYAPTEGKPRTHSRSCTACGYVDEVACTFDDGTVHAATCTQNGYTEYVCEECSFTYTDRETPKIPHDYGSWQHEAGTEGHFRVCNDCPARDTGSCQYTYATTDPTCTEGGVTVRTCSLCEDRTELDRKDALGHDYGDPQYDKKEGETPYHIYTCRREGCTPETDGHSRREACTIKDIADVPHCVDQGDVLHACEKCNYSEDVGDVAPIGHAWKDASDQNPEGWVSTEKDGVRMHTRTCSRCEEVETGECNLSVTVTDATCTAGRQERSVCALCGYDDTKTTSEPLQHDYTPWEHVPGTHDQTHSCQRTGCDETEEKPCPYDETVIKPTCEDQGYTHYVCRDCHDVYDSETKVPALGHNYEESPYLRGEGKTHYRVCKNDDSHVETTPCEVELETVVANCEHGGYTREHCDDCGYENYLTTEEALPHSYPADWTQNEGKHFRLCTECGHRDEVNCSYNDVVTLPTCEDDGYTTHVCTVCSYTYTGEKQDKLGHDWKLLEASTNDLTHRAICSRNPEHIEVQSCSYGLTEVPASCTEPGYHVHTCSFCQHTYRDAESEALGHNWQNFVYNAEDRTHAQSCSRCNARETEPCTFERGTPVAPTCQRAGYTVYTCSDCGGTYEGDPVGMLDHQFGAWTHVKAGFTALNSEHERTCSSCGLKERRQCELQFRYVEPTCTTMGYTEVTCKTCNREATKRNTIAKYGHSLGPWTYTGEGENHTHAKFCSRCDYKVEGVCDMVNSATASTCYAPGISTDVCKDCGHTESEEIEQQLSHALSGYIASRDGRHYRYCTRENCDYREENACEYSVQVTPVTCTEVEKTEKHCPLCNDTVVTYGEKPAGHRYDRESLVVTETDHKATCSVCGYVAEGLHDFTESNLCLCGKDALIYERPTVDGDQAAYWVASDDSRVMNAKNIVIPAYVDGYPVRALSRYLFYRNPSIETVVLPRTLEEIGEQAFTACPKLRSVTFEEGTEPCSLKYIRGNAFQSDAALTTVELPEGLEIIESYAFHGCSSLAEIDMPDSVVDIDDMAFAGTALYRSGANWEDGALYLGRHLIKVSSIPADGAFRIDEGTLTVSGACFEKLTALKTLYIPDSVTTFDRNAFVGCTGLESVEYEGDVRGWLSILFANDEASPMHYATGLHIDGAHPNEDGGVLRLDAGIQKIPAGTFRGNTLIKKIIIPDTVTSIGSYAFNGCTELAEVVVEGTLKQLGENVFDGTPFYENDENWDDGVLYLSDAQGGCYLLEADNEKLPESGVITIKSGTRIVCAKAFNGCTKLKEITVPETVSYIGAGAFVGTSLTSAKFEGEVSFFAFNTQGAGRSYSTKGGLLADPSWAASSLKGYLSGYWTKTLSL